jgi:hypothetical protein
MGRRGEKGTTLVTSERMLERGRPRHSNHEKKRTNEREKRKEKKRKEKMCRDDDERKEKEKSRKKKKKKKLFKINSNVLDGRTSLPAEF